MAGLSEESSSQQPGQRTVCGCVVKEDPAVAFARGMHTEMLATNQQLIGRAQILLSLNGVILGILGAGLAGDVEDLRNALHEFKWWMSPGVIVAGLALIASIVCCERAMYSSHNKRDVTPSDDPEPTFMWFFADVAHYEEKRGDFIRRGLTLSESDEVTARLQQALNMAPNIHSRATWLNSAFISFSVELVFLALTAASYVLRVG